MNTTSRREFLQKTSLALAASAPAALAQGANDRIRLGVIGPGGMGMNHLRTLLPRKDAEIAWLCDVDEARLAEAAAKSKAAGATPKTAKDMRRVFEDPSVDAVVIATPDHWHTPAALLALEAGKHVYVEKPCSHNLREGRLLVDAAEKAKRVVQVGTQSRSGESIRAAMQKLKEGAIGEILAAKAWNSQLRRNIGHAKPEPPPAGLDYDTWLGPAPSVPYRSNLLPGSWRWFHDFGAGDVGNDGVHDIDIARWGLGVDTHPTRVAGLGSKYHFEDDQEWPDTQYCIFEYELPGGKKKMLTFEMRIWSDYHQEGYENGCAFYGVNGYMLLGKGVGWRIFDKKDKLREEARCAPDLPAHHGDFFTRIRQGGKTSANAWEGHLSASLVHLGNIACRVGRTLVFDSKTERVTGDEAASKMLSREYRDHWARPKGA